ncbi:hypothetical protein JTE90_015920 [Oedothorax gibbosus]|uniref:UBR-type domain-containing protein n=1 Tax=Oedothorax gibbosus TaxID=931172 RepID=A0AAV6U4T5_9ARAC|nr:hypothetical protein JTE90_015920 [Oedothorax gibbosus]
MAESSNSNTETELTMCDVLQEEQELEEDANAVLGGSDDTNCSYDQGYVPRQALYACKTCSINGEAGVCLACCYACHDGHEVVELYTKRNFRCDCGNSKFNDTTCKLNGKKDSLNTKNKYNHNFKGLYCSCSRPYPDLEDDTPDEMIQCVFCEDWYHGRHLGSSVPDDYFEMICEQCMQLHKFLYSYLDKYNVIVDVVNTPKKEPKDSKSPAKGKSPRKTNLASPLNKATGADTKPIDVIVEESTANEVPVNNKNDVMAEKNSIESQMTPDPANSIEKNNHNSNSAKDHIGVNGKTSMEIVKTEASGSVKDEPVQNGDSNGVCLLKNLNNQPATSTGSAFWPENWRKELCRCSNCMTIYTKHNSEFLLDSNDTIQAYEERGKNVASRSQYDKGLDALSQLDRVKQMEAVRAYTSMKGELKEYLKEFADNKKTVCEKDIKEFFERMAKRKKLNNGVPHYCR